MEEATELYLETLKEQAMTFSAPPFVALETRVDYSEYAPDGFGTADCIMIGGGRTYRTGSRRKPAPITPPIMMELMTRPCRAGLSAYLSCRKSMAPEMDTVS